jgi:hypothetical protein
VLDVVLELLPAVVGGAGLEGRIERTKYGST